MKSLKKVVVAVLAAAVLVSGVSATASAATASVTKTSMSTVKATAKTVKYNKKAQTPAITVKDAEGNVLKKGVDYEVSTKKYTNSGTYTVTITGIGRYTGKTTAKFTIKGTASAKNNKITVKAAKSSVKATTVKKKAQKIKLTVTKNKAFKGAVTYKVTKYPKNAKKYISVSKKGVVTLKKGAKKGTYQVKVSVAGYKGYNPKTKTVTIKVK